MVDEKDPRSPLGDVTKRGYQGTHDPGQPANLMQQQTNPTGQTIDANQRQGATQGDATPSSGVAEGSLGQISQEG